MTVGSPLIVIEGAANAVSATLARLRAAGWDVRPGWNVHPPMRRTGRDSRLVYTGTVRNADDAGAALLAALDGAGLVVHASGDRLMVDRLLDDLRRLGPVDHRVDEADGTPRVTDEVVSLLRRLAGGESLGDAAAALGLPRRTADRRLATARRALGVERTTEAIARARRLGWLSE